MVSAIQPIALALPAPIRSRQSMSTPSATASTTSFPLTGTAECSASARAAGTMHTPTCPPPTSWVPSSSRHLAMTPFASTASGGATFPPWTTTVLPVPPPYPFAIRAIPRPASLALPARAAPMASRMVILTAPTTSADSSS